MSEEKLAKPSQPSSVEVRGATEKMMNLLRAGAEANKENRGMDSVVAQILNSDDPLAENTTTKVADILGLPLVIEAFYPTESREFDDPYAIIEAIDKSTGEKLVISCGGNVVLAQLLKMGQLGKYPFEAKFTSNPAQEGEVYRLTRTT